jgi:hypothetical protein
MTTLYDFTVKDIKNQDWKLADTAEGKVKYTSRIVKIHLFTSVFRLFSMLTLLPSVASPSNTLAWKNFTKSTKIEVLLSSVPLVTSLVVKVDITPSKYVFRLRDD